MTTSLYSLPQKEEVRLQAVLSLLRGETADQVSKAFRICRSALYKFHGRALNAMRDALADQNRGPKQPHNRIDQEREQKVISFCHCHPTAISYKVHEELGSDSPSPRTIQRVRKRNTIARLPKRAPPSAPAHRLLPSTIQRGQELIKDKPYLGPERIAWDLQNGEHLQISPSSVKRLKRKIHDAICTRHNHRRCAASMNATIPTVSGMVTSWRR